MQLGVSSYAFGWAVSTSSPPAPHVFDADALLAFAARHRVPVIQFGDNLPLHALGASELATFVTRARTQGVAIETGEGPLLGTRIEVHALRSDGSLIPVELAISIRGGHCSG